MYSMGGGESTTGYPTVTIVNVKKRKFLLHGTQKEDLHDTHILGYGRLEHLKSRIETRLTDERFESVMGECEI
jgi:hypothetical protein